MDKFLAARGAGEVESSGDFTIDLESALRQLTRFQLSDPHAYVNTIVSTAVLGGATFLEITTSQGACRYRFDGRVLEKSQLGALLGLQGDAFQREFSLLLLHCLAMAPATLRIQSAGGGIQITGAALVVDDGGSAQNVIEVGPVGNLRTRLNRLLVKPELAILRHSCRFAPLRITINNGRRIGGDLKFGRCLGARYIGSTRHLRIQAKTEWEPVEGPKLRNWTGTLVIGPERAAGSIVLVNGVAHALPFDLPYPNSGTLISAPSLTLDLSRSNLAGGEALDRFREEVEEEFEELALEASLEQKSPELLAQLWARHIPRLRRGDRYPFARKLRETPLYAMADESLQDLGTLVEWSDERGYLTTSLKPWPTLGRNIKRVWEPGEVILRTPFTQAALQNFNCVAVDHLASSKAMARLPEGDYLIRMPLLDCAGEIGLWESGAVDRYVGEIAEPSTEPFPPGCQVALPPGRSAKAHGLSTLPRLYRALLYVNPPVPEPIRNSHLLAYLCRVMEDNPGKRLADLPAKREGLFDLIRSVSFSRSANPKIGLDEILKRPTWLYREQPGGPPDTLLLDHSELVALMNLLPADTLTGHGLNHFSGPVFAFVQTRQQLQRSRKTPLATSDWLFLLAAQRDCAAAITLEKLGVTSESLAVRAKDIPAEVGQPGHDSEILRRESLTSLSLVRDLGACQISTDLVLLLLLRDPESAAARLLGEFDVTYSRVLAHVAKNMHREAISDLDRGLLLFPNAVDFRLRHDLRVARGEIELAAIDLREALAVESANKEDTTK